MTKKPNAVKQSFKNLIILVLSLALFAGPIAVFTFIVNRILSFMHLTYIRKYEKYKMKYEYEQIVPTLDENGDYVFETDRELKILHLTDLHIGGGFISFRKDRLAIKAIAKMVIVEKPDLVIVTGDIAYPVFAQSGAIGNIHQQRIMAKIFNTLGVYWTFVFGNHDAEAYSPFSQYHISRWYEKNKRKYPEYKYCIFVDKDNEVEVDGFGNQLIKVINTKKELVQNLILLDSHDYAKGNFLGLKPEYDHLKPSQVKWAVDKLETSAQENNGKMAKTLCFLHIPLVEYRDAWKEYRTNGNNETVQLLSGGINKKEEKYNRYKDKTWGINASSDRSDLFNALTSINTLSAVFCGHDHKNDMRIMYKGVLLSYSKPVDYLAYWGLTRERRYRGCNVINVKQDGTFNSCIYDFYDEKYVSYNVSFKDSY